MERCRLCYCNTNLEICDNIFNEKHQPPIWEIIAELTQLTIIKDDPYTKIICFECLEQLKKCNNFRKMILETDLRIRQNFENSSTIKIDNHRCIIKEEVIESDNTDYNDLIGKEPENSFIEAQMISERINIDIEGSCPPIKPDADEYAIKEESVDLGEDPLQIDANNPTTNTADLSLEHHRCDICNRTFLHRSMLEIHLRSHTGEKPYECTNCGAKFSQIGNFNRHLKMHNGEKPYNCVTCGKGFALTCNLQRHLKTHTGEKPYHCELCGKQFTQNHHLKDHLKMHNGEKPMNQRRHKSKSDKCDLKKRIRVRNADEKPFNCELCGKRFGFKHHLKDHLKIHTGEKPYNCEICAKQFARKSHLQRHLKVHN